MNININKPVLLKRIFYSPFANLLFRIVLGVIFIYSGTVKLIDPYTFSDTINAYGILPFLLVYPAAITISIIEIIAGFGVIFNLQYSLELITLMMIMFIGVLIYGIMTDLKIDCGCFSEEKIGEVGNLRQALYRDFMFVVIIIILFISRMNNKFNRPKSILKFLNQPEKLI
jgi:uncharacterized membrane protein YphA (DoxX/SURF4 family)